MSSEGYLKQTKDGVLLDLRVSPGAKATSITGLYGDHALRVKVASPPARGKANAEIEAHLSTLLGLSRSQVAIVKGAASREKVVLLEGVGLEEVRKGLSEHTTPQT